MSRTPDLTEVIEAGIVSALADVHTAIPGLVTRYDAATQTADVQPLMRAPYIDETGIRRVVSIPVVTGCPVAFQGGGGFEVTFPVEPGDIGILLFSESSLDKWMSGRGGEVDPDIDARFSLSDGMFIPGIRPKGSPRPATGSTIRVGRSGAPTSSAVLGEALRLWLNTHTHTSTAPGNPTSPPVVPAPPTILSTDVKIT